MVEYSKLCIILKEVTVIIMKITAKKIYGYSVKLICLMLVLGMMICSVPALAATTETASDATTEAEDPNATVQVVFAVEDIARGSKINARNLEVREVLAKNLPDNTMSSMEELLYKYATCNIYAGEYVYEDQTSGSVVVQQNEEVLIKPIAKCKKNYVIVTDYIKPNTGLAVEYYISRLIEENPQTTIYFPAGEYVFATPLETPAAAEYSVSLVLDDGAVIKAADNWKANGDMNALICLGASVPKNDIQSVGSYYQLQGGVLDCNEKTDGICIESGRETVIKNICIKNAKTGIHVKNGANSKSSDCDFEDITIIGNNKLGSVGINIVAYDNTFTTIRIYDMHTGIVGKGGGHLKDVYIINRNPEKMYAGTIGISNCGAHTSNIYVENYETAYHTMNLAWDCTAVWTSDVCKKQVAFQTKTAYSQSGWRAYFKDVEGGERIFVYGMNTARSSIMGSAFDVSLVTHETYKKLLTTDIIDLSKVK